MQLKPLVIAASLGWMATSAESAIVCTGTSALGTTVETTIDTQSQTVTVKVTDQGETVREAVFSDVTDQWDGHMTGLITAPGLSIKYEDHYGCIRNVAVVVDVRGEPVGYFSTVQSNVCSGGTTPDDLCLR